MKRFVFRPQLWVCLMVFAAAGAAHGQERFGALQGTISDDTDAVLPGVTVTLTNKFSDRVVTTTAGPYGNYLFRDVEPGRYSVTFELAGFTRMEFPDIDVFASQTFKLNTTLKPGPVTTTVQVIDVVPLIDTQSVLVAHQISQEEIDRLPKGRSFQSLAMTSPAVIAGEIEGGFQINGASGAENVFLIDGISAQSAIHGKLRQNAVFEYLREVQVTTAGFRPEYAGALGGVVSALTRSGGPQLHGDVWFYYSSDALLSTPPPRLVLDPADDRTVSYVQDQKSRARLVEPGFSLGGPLWADKLFFFTAWSPAWAEQDQLYNFSGGTEPGTIRQKKTFMSGLNKVTFEPSSRLRGNVNWLWSPATSEGNLPVYNGACPNCVSSSAAANAANILRGSFIPQSSYGANLDYALSPSILISARANYFWDNYKDIGIPALTSVTYQTPALGPLVPSGFQGPVGTQNTAAIQKTDHDTIARTTGNVDAGIRRSFFGGHNLKAGFGMEKIVNNVNRFFPGGYVLVWWDRAFTSLATGVQDRGTYGYYEVNDVQTVGSTGARTKSIYFQDTWRVTDRLTIDAGMRFENERVPSFRRDIRRVAIEFSWKDKMAPRFGAAFDLHGDGRVRIFGSWGRYVDTMKYDLARTVFGAEIWRTYYRSLDAPDVFGLSLDNMPGRDLWNPGVSPFRDRRSAIAGLNSVDPNLKPMSQDQWSFGTDYQWKHHTAIGVRFVHQSLNRAIEDIAVLFQGNAAYVYANPGEGLAIDAPFTTGLTTRPLTYPKPVRTYDALEITARRRFAGKWFGNLSYTYSRLRGNYAGLASSDEILTPTTGRSWTTAQQQGGSIAHPARNANYGWDLDEILFDSRGGFDPQGPLATDRPHALKWNGGYEFDLGVIGRTNVGAFFLLASGTPLSTRVNTRQNVPVFVNGRGDMGRTPAMSSTDLQVAHRISLTESQTVRVEFNVLNVFNQKTSRHRFDNLNRGLGVGVDSSEMDLSAVDLRTGYDYNALINAAPDGTNAFDPRYGMDDLFNEGIAARFGLKWSF